MRPYLTHFHFHVMHIQSRKILMNLIPHLGTGHICIYWKNKRVENEKGKQCRYDKFKTVFRLEHEVLGTTERSNFTIWRVSSHRLQIERGRYRVLPDKIDQCASCQVYILCDWWWKTFSIVVYDCFYFKDKSMSNIINNSWSNF